MRASEIQIVRALAGGGGSASVELVRADGQEWVLKRHRARDVQAERLFHRVLEEHDLPALRVADCEGLGPDQLLLEYVPGSPTIGGAPPEELCQRWGAAVARLHGIRFAEFLNFDEAGSIVPAVWRDFVVVQVRQTLERQRSIATDLPAGLLDQAERQLARLLQFNPSTFVLTHGDLHLNNALLRDDGIVLFDKAAGVWVAPAVFDLCLVYSEAFPGACYGAPRSGDDRRLSAFLNGYGELPQQEVEWLNHFVLLRALRRYPSPFVPELRSIIEVAMERLGSH